MTLGTTPTERVARMVAAGAYGTHPSGSTVSVRTGVNYIFLPVCGDRPSLPSSRLKNVPYGTLTAGVQLSCP